jgi:thiol-disulfide isomerase/thioredoxin
MIRLFVIFFFLILIFCGQSKAENKGKLFIEGNVVGKDTGYVVVSFESMGRIESYKLVLKSGSFFFKGLIKGIRLISISIDNKTASFWSGPGKISFFSDIADFAKISVKGSSTHNDVIRRNQLIDSVIISANSNENKEDERLLIYKSDTSFIKKNVHSYYSLILLDFYFEDLDYLYLKKILDIAGRQYRRTVLYKQLIRRYRKIEIAQINSPLSNFGFSDLNNNQSCFFDVIKANKILLIDFWASWCIPCRKNSGFLNNLYEKYSDRGLQILSVTQDTSQQRWRKAITQDSISNWLHIMDHKQGEISKMYAVFSIPTMILLDNNGKIIGRFSGKYIGNNKLINTIKQLLN